MSTAWAADGSWLMGGSTAVDTLNCKAGSAAHGTVIIDIYMYTRPNCTCFSADFHTHTEKKKEEHQNKQI